MSCDNSPDKSPNSSSVELSSHGWGQLNHGHALSLNGGEQAVDNIALVYRMAHGHVTSAGSSRYSSVGEDHGLAEAARRDEGGLQAVEVPADDALDWAVREDVDDLIR